MNAEVLHRCAQCGDTIHEYAVDSRDRKVCYLCCGVLDREEMMRSGKATLYLTRLSDMEWNAMQVMCEHSLPIARRYKVINYCKSLVINPFRVRDHHWDGPRRWSITYAYFVGPDGYEWYGRQAGDSEVLHCKRLKQQALSFAGVVWVSQDGRQTPLWQMQRGHLHNCIAMISRNLRADKGSPAFLWAHRRRAYIPHMQKILDIKTRRGDPWRDAYTTDESFDVLELEVTQ